MITEPFSDFTEDEAPGDVSDERPRKRARNASDCLGLGPEAVLPTNNIAAAQSLLAEPSLDTAARELLAQLGSLPSLSGVAKHFLKGISAVVKLHEQSTKLEDRATYGADHSDALAAAKEANEKLSKANKELRSEVNAVMEDSVATYIEISQHSLEYANNNIKLMNDFNPLATKCKEAVEALEERDAEVVALEEEVETFRLEEARLQAVIEGLTTEKAALEVQNLELHQQMENVQAPRKTRDAEKQKLTAKNKGLDERNKRQAKRIAEMQQEVRSLNVKLAKGKKGAAAEAVKSSNLKKDAAAGTVESSNQKEDTAAGTVKHHVA